MLAGFFARQGGPSWRRLVRQGRWDDELAADLHATAVAVSSRSARPPSADSATTRRRTTSSRTVDFLREVAGRLAGNINLTTAEKFADADPEVVFGETRAEGIAGGVTTLVAGFAVVEAGKRLAEAEGASPRRCGSPDPTPARRTPR